MGGTDLCLLRELEIDVAAVSTIGDGVSRVVKHYKRIVICRKTLQAVNCFRQPIARGLTA
jgi:hypothetical protein